MKKFLILLIFMTISISIFSKEGTCYSEWNRKTMQEKQNYIFGLLDGIYELGSDLDFNLRKMEKSGVIESEIADKMEIPALIGIFLYGNSTTNGINSLIQYVDDCYAMEEFRLYSVYQILIGRSKIEVKKNPKYNWMFEE